jgi:hypothetical protein
MVVTFDEQLTEGEVTDTCNAVVAETSAETGVDAAGILCEMSIAGAGRRHLLAVTYNLLLALTIPEDGTVPIDVVEALVESIAAIPELEGTTVILSSFTDGDNDPVIVEVEIEDPALVSFAAPAVSLAPCPAAFFVSLVLCAHAHAHVQVGYCCM